MILFLPNSSGLAGQGAVSAVSKRSCRRGRGGTGSLPLFPVLGSSPVKPSGPVLLFGEVRVEDVNKAASVQRPQLAADAALKGGKPPRRKTRCWLSAVLFAMALEVVTRAARQ